MRSLIVIFLILYLYPCSLWAGDGEILFWDDTAAGPSIFKINPDGTGLKEIIHNGRYPQWSPNKKMISYISSAGNIAIADSDGKKISEIESTPGSPGLLERDPSKAKILYHVWSPDGVKIGFLMTIYNNLYLLVHDLNSQKLIITTNMAPRQDDSLLSAIIQFSSNSEKLLFSVQDREDKGGTGFIDLKTKSIKLISQGFFARYWRDRILVVSLEERKTIFYASNEDGNQKEKIYESDSSLIPASEINNDRIFLLTQDDKGSLRLLLFDLKNKKIMNTAFSNFVYFQPQFSPGGKMVLTMGLPTGGETNAGYFVIDLENGNKTLIRKITKERDRAYWWRLYLGNQKDYSWR